MKMKVENIAPSAYYDDRVINYRIHVTTDSGQRLCCLDPSGAAARLRAGDCVNGLLTALHYALVPEEFGENCVTGIVRRILPVGITSAYRGLIENHFVGLETKDGILFLYCDQSNDTVHPLTDGQIVTVRITGGLYLELTLSEQFAV